MKIIVIGSGLIGLTTAYFLGRAGHDVTVIERQVGAGRETSFANGGLLSASMPEPWNSPGCWRVLLSSIGRSNSPLQLRLQALPSLLRWGITFLRNSNRAAYQCNTISNLRLALYSLEVLQSLRHEVSIEYSARTSGALKVFRSASGLDQWLSAAERLRPAGATFRRLSRSETIEIEPALAPIADQLVGSIHYATDGIGDAYRFSVGLAEHARQQGVKFLFGTAVTALETHSGRVKAVRTKGGQLLAEHYVLAAGSYSPALAGPVGVRLPVRPAKGYSLTFESPHGGPALQTPIVDEDLHAAAVPLGTVLRVAGTAEFAGFDLRMRPERVRNLAELAQRLLPRAGLNAKTARPWCGLRPMSADGVPIIGRTRIENLWVSTGHGHLGWTMAAGSGRLLTDLMCGRTTGVDPTPFALARFAANA